MNKSLFTKFRRLTHDAQRDLYDIIDCPFATDTDKATAQLALQQVNFLLSITDFDNVSTQTNTY